MYVPTYAFFMYVHFSALECTAFLPPFSIFQLNKEIHASVRESYLYTTHAHLTFKRTRSETYIQDSAISRVFLCLCSTYVFFFANSPLAHNNAYVHRYTYTYPRTHAQTRLHIPTHACTVTRTITHARMHRHAYTYQRTHEQIHLHIPTHTCINTLTYLI